MKKNLNYFLILIINLLLLSACKEKHPRELKMLDELDAILDSTEMALNYDLITLNNRTSRIHFHINHFKRFNKDTFTLETGNKLQKYKEISKIYKQFINNFEDVFNAMKQLEHQSKTLRNSVEDGKLSKEEFKKFYKEEEGKALKNLGKARRISKSVPEVEPVYQRLNNEMDAMLRHIAKSDTTLRNILKSEQVN